MSNEGGSTFFIRTEDDVYFLIEATPGLLDAQQVQLGSPRKSTKAPTVAPIPRPAEDEAVGLVQTTTENGRTVLSELGKLFEKRLNGRPCYPYLFESASIETLVETSGESRHDTVMKWVASVTHLVSNIEGWSPAAIYGLFVPAVRDLAPRANSTKTWLEELWSEVEWAGRQELTQIAEEKARADAVAEQVALEAADVRSSIFAGVRTWAGKSLPADETEAWGWIRKRMIVALSGGYCVMQRNGRYTKQIVPRDHLLVQVKHLGMDGVIDVRRTLANGNGNERDASPAELLSEHGIHASKVEAKPEIDGGYLDNPESPNPRLVIESFRRRRDITPKFSPDVDAWIREWAWEKVGDQWKSKYEILCRQLGAFLAFELGPVAAISFVGPPGAGKKMLIMALMDCLEGREIATERDLQESFNGGLLKSPFIVVDEGLMADARSVYAVADQFRKLSKGTPASVNEKFKPVITVQCCYRFLFCANNRDVILSLCKTDLRSDDRDALGDRIHHYEPGPRPTELLARNGDWKWTSGWVGDTVSASGEKWILARHLLWLHEKFVRENGAPNEKGFLVAGDRDGAIIREMQTQGGNTPAVIEATVKMLNATDGKQQPSDEQKRKWTTEEGRLYVTVDGIVEYGREHLHQEKLTPRKVSNILRGLVVGKRSSVHGKGARWNEVDVHLLRGEAEKYGWGCPTLDRLLKEQEAVMSTLLALPVKNGTNGTAAHHV